MRHRRTYVNPAKASIALLYGIPLSQAHTINIAKVQEYEIQQSRPMARLEKFLNRMGERHLREVITESGGQPNEATL